MTAAEEPIGTGHGEPHRVLVAVADPLCLPVSGQAEGPGVGGHVDRSVGRVQPEAVDVGDTGVLDGEPGPFIAGQAQPGLDDGDQSDGDRDEEDGPVAGWLTEAGTPAHGEGRSLVGGPDAVRCAEVAAFDVIRRLRGAGGE